MNIFGDDGLCQFDVYPNWTDGEQGDLRPLHMEDGVSFPPTAYPVLGFIAPKIEFYGDFRCLRHNLLDITQHIVMPLPENLRHLQAGDGGDREGPAKKAPCGWPGHAHRAENEAEGMEGQSTCWAASMAAVWGVFVGTFYKLAYPAAHALAASTGLRKSGRPRSV